MVKLMKDKTSGWKKIKKILVLFMIFLLTIFTAMVQAVDYNFSTLLYPGASHTEAFGIDGKNIVGGYSDNGFLYDRSIWTTLNSPYGGRTLLVDIDGNKIVGICGDEYNREHGCLYDGSTWTKLDFPGPTGIQTHALGIDGNKIVGLYTGGAFLYDGSEWITLNGPDPSHQVTSAWGIDGNNIVGLYNSGEHSFLYDGSTWTNIDFPGATATSAYGIEGDNIVGNYTDISGKTHGFLYDGSTWTIIDFPGAIRTVPYKISGDTIVGWYSNADGRVYGFVAGPPIPIINITPSIIDFGLINVGSTSAPQIFTISNDGTIDLVIDTITSTNPSEFIIQNDSCSGYTVAPSSSCIVQVAFSPALPDLRSAILNIPSNDPNNNPLNVSLSGTGVTTLNVSINPTGGGSVTGENINCPGDCTQTYTTSDTVTLTTNHNTGYSFSSWTGCNTAVDNQCTAIMDANRNVTATFVPITTPMPDLTGTWTDISKKYLKKSKQYRVIGVFNILNIGSDVAKGIVVNFYLSNDNTFDAGDTLIETNTSKRIIAGNQKNSVIRFVTTTDPVGKYLIGVIDPLNTINELNEGNNSSNAMIP